MDRRIKEIYNCERLEGTDPLVYWYNQVIEKVVTELNVGDVARCFRQELFLDVAYDMTLVYLLNNPYEGDLYAGELMEKASKMDVVYIEQHKNVIAKIIEKAESFIANNVWESNAERSEFEQSVRKLKVILNGIS